VICQSSDAADNQGLSKIELGSEFDYAVTFYNNTCTKLDTEYPDKEDQFFATCRDKM
jgi:hypothetical protein